MVSFKPAVISSKLSSSWAFTSRFIMFNSHLSTASESCLGICSTSFLLHLDYSNIYFGCLVRFNWLYPILALALFITFAKPIFISVLIIFLFSVNNNRAHSSNWWKGVLPPSQVSSTIPILMCMWRLMCHRNFQDLYWLIRIYL